MQAVAVLTISDTCFKDNSKDTAGPAIAKFLKEQFPHANLHTIIIPDEREIIERELKYFSDEAQVNLVITTGGTGLGRRDVTPEATKTVIQKEVPAIPIAMTLGSLKQTPMAMLSRSVAGIRDKTLIINLPGSKKAVTECIDIIKPILTHAVSLLTNDETEIQTFHNKMQFGHSCPNRKLGSNVDVSKVALRPRESPFPMVEMVDAFKILDTVMQQWPAHLEIVAIDEALGRIVAEEYLAKEPMPPFPASVKDGYACMSADGAGVRRVRGALCAGDAPVAPLAAGECARVNTGAALPCGADCVVQVEDTKLVSASEDSQTELQVEIVVAPAPMQDVRPVGFDIPMGAVLVGKGSVLDPAQIGILAGAGYQHVTVRGKPKVALLSTGNELQEPSEVKLRPSHIRDSNRTMLKALLAEHGYDSIDCGIARDEPGELVAAIAGAFSQADLLVCSGGVSMGDKDLLKPVLLKDFGATLHYGRVRMKPGKPTTFATCQVGGKTKYVFALPGNPVSAYVCALLFVLRALRACTGRGAGGAWPRLRARTTRPAVLDARPEYARAALRHVPGDDVPHATVLGTQNSSRLFSACGASVLLELPPASTERAVLPPGSVVDALIIGRIEGL